VRCTSPGPAFFVQTRVGRDGARFGMVKFRSMYADAEMRRAALLADSDREGVCFKMKDDPRVTPLGRFLRRSSLDELPQLFNVLWGDMSLVGPRPALPQEVARYPEHAMGRLSVLPGITGVWQVSGRAEVSFEDMVAMDLAYARGHSVAGDLAILWRTLGVVLTGRGAY
jgi:lipopolysaccharide/colanic/teichoic acid biosynthesis glycosyltransferase